jgi:hypothetical protein
MKNRFALLFVLLFIIDLSDGEIGPVSKKFPSRHSPFHNFLIKDKDDVKQSSPVLSAPVLTLTAPSPCIKSAYFPFKPCPFLLTTPEIVFQGAGCGGLPG